MGKGMTGKGRGWMRRAGLATLVEKKSRRMELAFYCLSRVPPAPPPPPPPGGSIATPHKHLTCKFYRPSLSHAFFSGMRGLRAAVTIYQLHRLPGCPLLLAALLMCVPFRRRQQRQSPISAA